MTRLTLQDLRRTDAMDHEADLEAENRRLREALDETRRRAMTLGYTGLAHFIGVTMMDAALAAEPASGEADSELPTAADVKGILGPPPPTQGEEETAFIVSQLEELRERLSEFGCNGLDASTCLGLVETIAALRQRADEATRAENEAIAGLADRWHTVYGGGAHDIMHRFAAAIRARITP